MTILHYCWSLTAVLWCIYYRSPSSNTLWCLHTLIGLIYNNPNTHCAHLVNVRNVNKKKNAHNILKLTLNIYSSVFCNYSIMILAFMGHCEMLHNSSVSPGIILSPPPPTPHFNNIVIIWSHACNERGFRLTFSAGISEGFLSWGIKYWTKRVIRKLFTRFFQK